VRFRGRAEHQHEPLHQGGDRFERTARAQLRGE